jgi:hypothetical protein
VDISYANKIIFPSFHEVLYEKCVVYLSKIKLPNVKFYNVQPNMTEEASMSGLLFIYFV